MSYELTAKTEAGNEYKISVYEDPMPGKKGTDLVFEECGACSGTGIYQGPSGLKIYTATVGAVDKGCFQCDGKGGRKVKVSSIRARERRTVNRSNEWAAQHADENSPAAVAAREAAEAAEKRQAEEAEAARRAALVTGFAAPVGERIRKVAVTVVTNYRFEKASFNGYGVDYKSLIIATLADGKVVKIVTDARDFEKGDELVISGTVKSHDNYEGQDQTVLARVIFHS